MLFLCRFCLGERTQSPKKLGVTFHDVFYHFTCTPLEILLGEAWCCFQGPNFRFFA